MPPTAGPPGVVPIGWPSHEQAEGQGLAATPRRAQAPWPAPFDAACRPQSRGAPWRPASRGGGGAVTEDERPRSAKTAQSVGLQRKPQVEMLPAQIAFEVSALRSEIAEHNDRLMELVALRLEALGSQSGCAGSSQPKGAPSTPVTLAVPQPLLGRGGGLRRGSICSVGKPIGAGLAGALPFFAATGIADGSRPGEGDALEIASCASEEQEVPASAVGGAAQHLTTPVARSRRPSLRANIASKALSTKEHVASCARASMFADTDQLKQELLQDLHRGSTGTHAAYRDEGWSQRLVRRREFEALTLVVVAVNAVWIGYEIDKNPADALPDAPAMFQVLENLFCLFFTFEILVRFAAFRVKLACCKEMHFLFDAALVAVMIFETWMVYPLAALAFDGQATSGGFSGLRVLRLTRMCRLVRLFRAVPDLMILLKGMSLAFRSIFWTMMLLLMMVYVYAVAFKILTKGNRLEEIYFRTVLDSMATLMLPGLLPDSAAVVYSIGEENLFFAALFMTFVVIGTLAVMNLLIGVMVEGVSTVAAVEKEASAMAFVKRELRSLLESLDCDDNAKLSRNEVGSILLNPDACRLIAGVGVDVSGLVEIAEYELFNKTEEITFPEFVELVLRLRGNNVATVRDIISLRKCIMEELEGVGSYIVEHIQGRVRAVPPKLDVPVMDVASVASMSMCLDGDLRRLGLPTESCGEISD